jgi:apolipoprotein N-acyltransferase
VPLGQAPIAFKPAAALAALSGLFYFLAFPGIDVWPFAFVTFVPIMIALRGQTPKHAAWLGWIMGMVMGLCGFYWLLGMLQTFSGFPLPLCALFMVILCGFQAGITGLMGFLYSRGVRRGHWPGLCFALAFIASETLWPLLFPFNFAATLHTVPVLVQLAELGGPKLVALPLIAVSWAASECFFAWRESKRTGERIPARTIRKLAILAAMPALAALYGVVRIHQVDAAVASAEKFRVGLVQANMGLKEKRANRAEGLKRHVDLTKQLRQEKVDLVVWSETSVTGAVNEQNKDDVYYRTITRYLRVPTIVGAVLLREVEDSREYVLFNSALLADKNGRIKGRYDKQFLLAFGEYLPFGDTFPILYDWSPNSGRFSPGTSFEPLKLGKHGIATFICYEDIIPSFVNRIMNEGEAGLLVNMTNDAWFGDTIEPYQHMALSKLRAVEQRRFFVRSTNSGVSGIVDPVGRTMVQSKTFVQAALSADVAWLDLGTLYRVLGDTPWWLLSFASIALSLRSFRRPAKA